VLLAVGDDADNTFTLSHAGHVTTLCGSQFMDDQFSSILIQTGNGNDTVRIEETRAGVQANVLLGAGTTSVGISPRAESLDLIQGDVKVRGGSGPATLTCFDRNDPRDETYTILPSGLWRSLSGVISYQGLSDVVIDGGSGLTTYNVEGTAFGTTVTVNGGSGQDALRVSPTRQTLGDVQGPLLFHGAPGSSGSYALIYDSFTPFDKTVVMSPTAGTNGTSIQTDFSAIIRTDGLREGYVNSGLRRQTFDFRFRGGFGPYHDCRWTFDASAAPSLDVQIDRLEPGLSLSVLGGSESTFCTLGTAAMPFGDSEGEFFLDGGTGTSYLTVVDLRVTDYTVTNDAMTIGDSSVSLRYANVNNLVLNTLAGSRGRVDDQTFGPVTLTIVYF
jgi:hypothetical protein